MTEALRLAALITFAASIACGGPSVDGGRPSPSVESTSLPAAEALKPSVEITYPPEGEPVSSADLLVAVTVRSFGIVDDVGAKPKKGEGHLVYYLDVDEIPTEDGASAVTRKAGRSKASTKTSHTWSDVAPGAHTLGVQLVNNDDTPLDPPVTDEIDVTVEG